MLRNVHEVKEVKDELMKQWRTTCILGVLGKITASSKVARWLAR